MSLPPPDKAGQVHWRDDKIAPPAFRLTPLEKPAVIGPVGAKLQFNDI